MRFQVFLTSVTLAGTLHAQAPDTMSAIIRGELGARADSVMLSAEARGLSGIAFVAKDGAVVLKKGYGMSDRANNIAANGSSVFPLHSITKAYTATAILQLYEEGKLGIDDSITRFFAGVPAEKQAITIRQLIRHTSGLDDYLGPDYEVVGRDEMLRRAMALRMKFAPGTGQVYSNAGYNLLAAIVEKVSGQPFERYVREHMLLPLGLVETGLVYPGFDRHRVMHQYAGSTDMKALIDLPHDTDGVYWNLRGAGGFLSTASELFRFFEALRAGRLIRTETLALGPFYAMIAGADNWGMCVLQHDAATGYDVLVVSTVGAPPANQALAALRSALGFAAPTLRPKPRASGEGAPDSTDRATSGIP